MSVIGYGYGSEWHLLRYLGYHRGALNDAVMGAMPDVKSIEWFDFRFNPRLRLLDAEHKGLEFMAEDEPARVAWGDFWPSTGNPPNWDAVALLTLNSNDLCWMLVEAKAHLDEGKSDCHAKPATQGGGRDMIERALQQTKTSIGARPDADWMSGYYQHANRLATLYHIDKHGPPSARLLHLLFVGDTNPNAVCPETGDDWGPTLETMEDHLGLTHQSDLEQHVYTLFLNVCGENAIDGGARG
jgi:hypothetical protein